MTLALVMLTLGSCKDVFSECACETPAAWAVLGVVTTSDAGAVVRGGTTFGSAPAEVPVSLPAGTRVLVSDERVPLIIDGAGRATCSGITLDATAYAPTLVDGTCRAALSDAGLSQPPCRDVDGCGCSSSVTNLSLAMLITIAIRSKKRRRADL